MEKIILHNGLTFIYEYRQGDLTSFSIGFEAGAFMEDEENIGAAHLLEHMLFKGTTSKSEDEINSILDELFVFNNAMTNYPYAIYYGTTLKEDFEKGFRLYSDIILNPMMSGDGFITERDVVIQESKEWKEDFEQLLEDEMLFNGYDTKRIKDIIIGDEKNIRNLTMKDLNKFYKEYYVANNCVISVVTSMDYNEVFKIIFDIWGKAPVNEKLKVKELKETMNCGIYEKEIEGFLGAKILYGFDISSLSIDELKDLYVFNGYFGEGVSSKLYDKIRTENGLSYDVYGKIKYEKNIGLYTIYAGCKKSEIYKVKELIDSLLNSWKEEFLKIKSIDTYKKRIKMRKEFLEERTIERAKWLCVNNIMFHNDMDLDSKDVTAEKVLETACKVLKNPIVQIIR